MNTKQKPQSYHKDIKSKIDRGVEAGRKAQIYTKIQMIRLMGKKEMKEKFNKDITILRI